MTASEREDTRTVERKARRPRVFVDARLAAGVAVTLAPERAHHLVDVLRLKAGAPLLLFDGRGDDWTATLSSAGKRAEVQVHERLANACESTLAITLWQGLSQGARMDACLRQAVELGVHGFRPVLANRSSGKPDAKRARRKREHWQAIAISSAEQSGRAVVPRVHELAALTAHIDDSAVARRLPNGLALVLLPEAEHSLLDVDSLLDADPRTDAMLVADSGLDAPPLQDIDSRPTTERAPRSIELLIGPESGLDEHEAQRAIEAGFVAVRLGPRVLRTETAGPAAIAALQARFGDLTR